MSTKARKTFDVQTFKAEINRRLALPLDAQSDDARRALCSIVEHVLLDANAYRGYNDLHWMREGGWDTYKARVLDDTTQRPTRQEIHGTDDGHDAYRRVYF